jgi:hypothetical protein
MLCVPIPLFRNSAKKNDTEYLRSSSQKPEHDPALEQLEIVATIPAGVTYGDLKFNPCWDSLRGDPRFDKIVAAAKAASR